MENNNLIDAIKKEDLALVKKLIKDNVDIINNKDENGYTALMIAAENGYREITKILMLSGADTTITSNDNTTALSLAEKNEHNEIIMLLECVCCNYEDIESVDSLEDCLLAFDSFGTADDDDE